MFIWVEKFSSQSRVTPRSRTAEENVRRGKAADKAAMSKCCCQLLAGAQPDELSFAEFSRSRLEDIQAPRAPMMKVMTCVVAIASEAEQYVQVDLNIVSI